MLLADLGDFCSRLQMDKLTRLLSAYSTAGYEIPVKLNTKLQSNLGTTIFEVDLLGLQNQLFRPIQHNLRGCHDLTLKAAPMIASSRK